MLNKYSVIIICCVAFNIKVSAQMSMHCALSPTKIDALNIANKRDLLSSLLGGHPAGSSNLYGWQATVGFEKATKSKAILMVLGRIDRERFKTKTELPGVKITEDKFTPTYTFQFSWLRQYKIVSRFVFAGFTTEYSLSPTLRSHNEIFNYIIASNGSAQLNSKVVRDGRRQALHRVLAAPTIAVPIWRTHILSVVLRTYIGLEFMQRQGTTMESSREEKYDLSTGLLLSSVSEQKQYGNPRTWLLQRSDPGIAVTVRYTLRGAARRR
jgi:hypothetical protein